MATRGRRPHHHIWQVKALPPPRIGHGAIAARRDDPAAQLLLPDVKKFVLGRRIGEKVGDPRSRGSRRRWSDCCRPPTACRNSSGVFRAPLQDGQGRVDRAALADRLAYDVDARNERCAVKGMTVVTAGLSARPFDAGSMTSDRRSLLVSESAAEMASRTCVPPSGWRPK